MSVVLAVANQKGGVGKTTLSVSLAGIYSGTKKVLLIDFDTQGSSTLYFKKDDIDFSDTPHDINLIFDKKTPTPIEISNNLYLLPASIQLQSKVLSCSSGKEIMLKRYINKIKDDYDIIIVDSSPSFSELMVNVIVAGDIIVIPVETGALEEGGMVGFLDIVEDVVDVHQIDLSKIVIIPNKYDKRVKDNKDILQIIKEETPEYIKSLPNLGKFTTIVTKAIPVRSVFKYAASYRIPVVQYIDENGKRGSDLKKLLQKIAKSIIKGV